MQKIKLEGIFIPNITPFSQGNNIDEEALRKCIRFWIKGKVSAIMPCGSNGEAPYLTREERKKVIKIAADEAVGKIPVIAGTGAISTCETILLTKDAKDLGADAVLVVTPFYFKLSNQEIYRHYCTLLDAVDIPTILYSVSKFTGFALDPAVVAKLASEYANVVGVKYSEGDVGAIAKIIKLVGNKISVLAGTADIVLPTLMLGGKGAVVAVANVFPKLCSDLYEAFKKGDYEKAGRLQHRVSYLNEVLVKRHNQLSAIKEAMNVLGLPAGYPRMPSLPLNENEKKEVKNVIKAMEEPL